MNPSIKRLLGALLLIGTLGVTSVLAVRAGAVTDTISSHPSLTHLNRANIPSGHVDRILATGDALNG